MSTAFVAWLFICLLIWGAALAVAGWAWCRPWEGDDR